MAGPEGAPPSGSPAFSRYIRAKVQGALATARFGPQATPQQASQAFQDWLRRALRTADIEVNPLYGRFDPAQARICPIQSTAATPACPTA